MPFEMHDCQNVNAVWFYRKEYRKREFGDQTSAYVSSNNYVDAGVCENAVERFFQFVKKSVTKPFRFFLVPVERTFDFRFNVRMKLKKHGLLAA